MDRIHHDITSGFDKAIGAFNTEGLMRGWQQGTMRVLRAQERIMEGMVAAARLEMRYGQELMANRLGMMKWEMPEPGHSSSRATDEVDKFISVVREVTEELRTSFTEATKLLNGSETAAEARKAGGAARHTKTAVTETSESDEADEIH